MKDNITNAMLNYKYIHNIVHWINQKVIRQILTDMILNKYGWENNKLTEVLVFKYMINYIDSLVADSAGFIDAEELENGYNEARSRYKDQISSLCKTKLQKFIDELYQSLYNYYYSPMDKPEVLGVLYSGNETKIIWDSKAETLVTCGENDKFDPRVGFLIAFYQKHSGLSRSKSNKFLDELNDIYYEKEKAFKTKALTNHEISIQSITPINVRINKEKMAKIRGGYKKLRLPINPHWNKKLANKITLINLFVGSAAYPHDSLLRSVKEIRKSKKNYVVEFQ